MRLRNRIRPSFTYTLTLHGATNHTLAHFNNKFLCSQIVLYFETGTAAGGLPQLQQSLEVVKQEMRRCRAKLTYLEPFIVLQQVASPGYSAQRRQAGPPSWCEACARQPSGSCPYRRPASSSLLRVLRGPLPHGCAVCALPAEQQRRALAPGPAVLSGMTGAGQITEPVTSRTRATRTLARPGRIL